MDRRRWFRRQTLTAPIRLQADIEQQTPHGEYRLVQEGDDWILQFRHHDHWQSMYRFDLVVQHQSDYLMGNFWSAHWPQSHFRHHLLMCRHLPDGGKLTLTNFHFTRYQDGRAIEQINLPDVASLYALLQEQFGLGVDDVKHGFTEDEWRRSWRRLIRIRRRGNRGIGSHAGCGVIALSGLREQLKIYRPFGVKQDHCRTGNSHFFRQVFTDSHRHINNTVTPERAALMPLNT